MDANEWLLTGATGEDFAALAAAAPTWVEVLAGEAGRADDGRRGEALRRACRMATRLETFEFATYRKRLAQLMGVGVREFDSLVKAVRTEGAAEAAGVGAEPGVIATTVGGQVQVDGGDEFFLIETLYEPPEGSAGAVSIGQGRTGFAIREPSGEIRTGKYLDVDGVRFVPPRPESAMLAKGVVSFARGVGAQMELGELVEEVRKTFHRYVDVDPFFERLASYYVVFTWLYDCFNVVPYIRFRGDYGTGKSRALTVMGALCFRPMRASGAATVSPIFRMLDQWRGTLLLEEADYAASDFTQDIVKILNTGYDRDQAVVLRSGDKMSGFEPEAFIVFGPKLVAMRGEYKDRALISRFLTKDMGGATTRADIPIELPKEFKLEEAPRLRGLLLRYRLENWKPYVTLNYEALDLSIEPRLNQIVLSLYSLVDDAGLLEELKSFVEAYNRQLIEDRGLTLASKVLEGLVIQFEIERDKVEGKRDLSTLTITRRANQLIDFENLGYEGYHQRDKNKSVKDRKVGGILRRTLHFVSERNSAFNGRHVVVWNEQRVTALRRRYGLTDDRLKGLMEIVYKLDMLDVKTDPGQDEIVF